MRTRKTVVLVLLAVLSLAVPAAAQQVNAPPGNAGVDEYLETVPGAGGNRPTNRDTGRAPLPAPARRALERQGTDGQAAADLAERTGPAPTQRDKQPAPAAQPPGGDRGGALGALGRAADGSDEGMGLVLPILLALSAAAALAALLVRRRFTER